MYSKKNTKEILEKEVVTLTTSNPVPSSIEIVPFDLDSFNDKQLEMLSNTLPNIFGNTEILNLYFNRLTKLFKVNPLAENYKKLSLAGLISYINRNDILKYIPNNTIIMSRLNMHLCRTILIDRLLTPYYVDNKHLVEEVINYYRKIINTAIDISGYYKEQPGYEVPSYFTAKSTSEFVVQYLKKDYLRYRVILKNLYDETRKLLSLDAEARELIKRSLNIENNTWRDREYVIYLLQYFYDFPVEKKVIFTANQRKQLESYFGEIKMILELIAYHNILSSTNTLYTFKDLTQFTLINLRREDFFAKEISNNTFSLIISMLNLYVPSLLEDYVTKYSLSLGKLLLHKKMSSNCPVPLPFLLPPLPLPVNNKKNS